MSSKDNLLSSLREISGVTIDADISFKHIFYKRMKYEPIVWIKEKETQWNHLKNENGLSAPVHLFIKVFSFQQSFSALLKPLKIQPCAVEA